MTDERVTLPEAECKFGYPHDQLLRVLGDRLAAFDKWGAGGLTGAICEGKDGCGPHGVVVYRHDVQSFLEGMPNLD